VLDKRGRPEADDLTMISAGDIHLSLLPGAVRVGLTAAFLLFAWMALFGGYSRKRTATFDVLLHRVNALREEGFLQTQHAKRAAIKVRARMVAEARMSLKQEEFFKEGAKRQPRDES